MVVARIKWKQVEPCVFPWTSCRKDGIKTYKFKKWSSITSGTRSATLIPGLQLCCSRISPIILSLQGGWRGLLPSLVCLCQHVCHHLWGEIPSAGPLHEYISKCLAPISHCYCLSGSRICCHPHCYEGGEWAAEQVPGILAGSFIQGGEWQCWDSWGLPCCCSSTCLPLLGLSSGGGFLILPTLCSWGEETGKEGGGPI